MFAQDMESQLPYHEVITEALFSPAEVMMDGNQIVLLQVRFSCLDYSYVLNVNFGYQRADEGLDTLTVLRI
jgi:hypothetical protein